MFIPITIILPIHTFLAPILDLNIFTDLTCMTDFIKALTYSISLNNFKNIQKNNHNHSTYIIFI